MRLASHGRRCKGDVRPHAWGTKGTPVLFVVIAAILVVFYTVRKLGAQRQRAEDYPHVAPDDFARWQRKELLSARLGSWACFLYVFIGLSSEPLYDYMLREGISTTGIRAIGRLAFALWGVCVGAAFLTGVSSGVLRKELRMGPPPKREKVFPGATGEK